MSAQTPLAASLSASLVALFALAVAALADPTASVPSASDGPQPAEASALDEDAGPGEAEDALPERYETWLAEVAPLIDDVEREVFLAIRESYRRDQFIRGFWDARDPYPQTVRNELQEQWEERSLRAKEMFEDPGSEGARMVRILGPPDRRSRYSCEILTSSLDVWHYDNPRPPIAGSYTLVFLGRGAEQRGFGRLWQPDLGIGRVVAAGVQSRTPQALAQALLARCTRGDDIVASLAQSLDLARIGGVERLLPRPDTEWALAFAARSTEVPDDAVPLHGELHVTYPARHQSRTVVQGTVTVPRSELATSELGGHLAHNLLVDGEILRQGELFDRFRYRFDFPLPTLEDAGERIPLAVQRYLRPGDYTLIVKVADSNSKAVFREERVLEVPRVERKPVGTRKARAAAAPAAEPAPLREVPRELSRFDEANRAIATGDHTVEILPVSRTLTVGKLRVETLARGPGIARVAFELDGRPVMRKSRPPYSVELDLGNAPQIHTVRAVALDEEGTELASDEIVVNAGPHRFAVRLLEPQPGRRYRDSLRVHAEIETPEDERLDRVEIFLNDTRLATLYQPPWEQPILLDSDELTWVRVVAFLEDGATAEDVRFVNAPDFVDELDVQMVQLYTSVVDRKGNFVDDLAKDDFLVREEGREQSIRRFELVRDLPIRAGVILDTSTSMLLKLPDVEKAAYQFLETIVTPRDRAAVITFNDAPRLAVRFTNDRAILAGGLAGLAAEGETALYDSVVFALHYFGGLKGKRAIVVLTDGEDSKSEYTFDQALEFARRSGVAIYVIGLDIGSNQHDARMKMNRFATETGGECFFVEGAYSLGRVYAQIQQELRSQYLLVYQSSSEGSSEFRRVEVEVAGDRKGLEAKSIPGYYP